MKPRKGGTGWIIFTAGANKLYRTEDGEHCIVIEERLTTTAYRITWPVGTKLSWTEVCHYGWSTNKHFNRYERKYYESTSVSNG